MFIFSGASGSVRTGPWKFAFAFECLLPPVGGGAWGARSRPVPAGIGQGYVGESCGGRLWEFGDDV